MKMDYCDEGVMAFASKYSGQIIRFDGIVTNVAPHGNASTRYDILISPGNKVDTTTGPIFKYEDVNATSDLNWSSADAPDSLDSGLRLQFTAEIGNYDEDSCIFFLDPVSTEPR